MAGPEMNNPGHVRQGPAEGDSSFHLAAFIASVTGPVRDFPLGRIVATPNALAQIPETDIRMGLMRHRKQDWGNVDPSDHALNDQALQEGTRILSAYRAANGVAFWIITEADRSVTTILMPEDY